MGGSLCADRILVFEACNGPDPNGRWPRMVWRTDRTSGRRVIVVAVQQAVWCRALLDYRANIAQALSHGSSPKSKSHMSQCPAPPGRGAWSLQDLPAIRAFMRCAELQYFRLSTPKTGLQQGGLTASLIDHLETRND